MCKLCCFVSNSKSQANYWTRLNNHYFQTKKRKCSKNRCKKFSMVQTRVFCFHESHLDGPIELPACQSPTAHRNSTFCLIHPSKTESLPLDMSMSSFAQEYSKNNITKKPFTVDLKFRQQLNSNDRYNFARQGFSTINIDFTPDQEEQLNACMVRIRSECGTSVKYLSGHRGHIITKENMDRLLPLALRRAILTQDLLHSVEHYFGVPGSLTLFSLEVHEVVAGAPEQTAHADVTLDENLMHEEIRRLAVTCIISIKGPATTMVYPKTAAKIQSEDELVGMHCIRATEDRNCVLLDASLSHKGSANNSNVPTLRFIFTFIQTSASKKQSNWVQKCIGVKKPLNLSAAQFFGEQEFALPAAEASVEDPVAVTSAAAGSTGPSPQESVAPVPGKQTPSASPFCRLVCSAGDRHGTHCCTSAPCRPRGCNFTGNAA